MLSFDRWKVIVNVMLLKEPNNPRIHRLRVIHLYEADFNLLLGVKWRNIIHHSLDKDILHPSQYGSLPGRESLIRVSIKEMQNEIARTSRKPYIKQTLTLNPGFHQHPAFLDPHPIYPYQYHTLVCSICIS
jgi:hypothetical protein